MSVTIHCSWNGLIRSWVGAGILVVLAVASLALGGLSWVSGILALLAVGFGAVVLFDLPVATTFDEVGVLRRCPLRHHRMTWASIRLITRHADLLRSVGRDDERGRPQRALRRVPGGLTAVVGRRRYLLLNQPEGLREFERMQAFARAADVEVVAEPPAKLNSPTWIHRAAKWWPSDPDEVRDFMPGGR